MEFIFQSSFPYVICFFLILYGAELVSINKSKNLMQVEVDLRLLKNRSKQ